MVKLTIKLAIVGLIINALYQVVPSYYTNWQFQDALYANQGEENSGWVTDALLEKIAKGLGLDWAKLKKDADGAVTLQQANSMADEANQRQIQGTPTFYVQVGDQQPYQVNPSSFEPSEFASILDDALSS